MLIFTVEGALKMRTDIVVSDLDAQKPFGLDQASNNPRAKKSLTMTKTSIWFMLT